MTEGQEWTIAWLAAGGLLFIAKQIAVWIYYIIKRIKRDN